ncbi:MAG: hypothetical protein LBQ00_03980 [Syntrophobacterales bacterium]|jgi:hypothetical protein|nr:hypothetical protein [Syntrophobacterales bacterium]
MRSQILEAAQGKNSKVLVLVGFAEALSAPEVVWSLVDEGFEVIAFARRGRRSSLHHSRYVTCYEITPPETDLAKGLAELNALLVSLATSVKESQRVLFPLDDSAVWMCGRVSLSHGWTLAGPSGVNIDLALDKSVQIQAAMDAGFKVPRTFLAETPRDILNNNIAFPFILKPAQSVLPIKNRLRKYRTWICGSREELEKALNEWDGAMPLLAQPLINGVGEGVFGLATPGHIRAWSAHKRLRMMNPHGSGSSACISQKVSEEFIAPIEKLVSTAEWRGLFMIELLRDASGVAWFMEINGRPWGSMALARRQGLEYPAWNINLSIGTTVTIAEPLGAPGIVCRHLGRELMYPIFVLRGPKSKALRKWPSFWKALRDVVTVRRGDFLYNWRRDDPKVLFVDSYYTLRDQLSKRGR